MGNDLITDLDEIMSGGADELLNEKDFEEDQEEEVDFSEETVDEKPEKPEPSPFEVIESITETEEPKTDREKTNKILLKVIEESERVTNRIDAKLKIIEKRRSKYQCKIKISESPSYNKLAKEITEQWNSSKTSDDELKDMQLLKRHAKLLDAAIKKILHHGQDSTTCNPVALVYSFGNEDCPYKGALNLVRKENDDLKGLVLNALETRAVISYEMQSAKICGNAGCRAINIAQIKQEMEKYRESSDSEAGSIASREQKMNKYFEGRLAKCFDDFEANLKKLVTGFQDTMEFKTS